MYVCSECSPFFKSATPLDVPLTDLGSRHPRLVSNASCFIIKMTLFMIRFYAFSSLFSCVCRGQKERETKERRLRKVNVFAAN